MAKIVSPPGTGAHAAAVPGGEALRLGESPVVGGLPCEPGSPQARDRSTQPPLDKFPGGGGPSLWTWLVPEPRELGRPPCLSDGPPALYGVNQVVNGGPVNSDFSQLHPLARLPESLRSSLLVGEN